MITLAKTPLRYPGGKSRAIKQIMPHLPTNIGEYREPFIGGGSVFLRVKSLFQKRIQHYWINDLNNDLYFFWKYARDDIEALVEGVLHYKQSFQDGRELFQFFCVEENSPTDFDKAVRFFIMNRITFSGTVDSGGYSQQAFEKRFTDSSIERLRNVSYYLQGVTITCGDYSRVLNIEGEDVFLFLDPPYLSASKSRLYGVRGQLHTDFDHTLFAEKMRDCPHKWLITYDDSPEVRELFSFATIIEWQLQYGMNNYKQDKAEKGNELFIKNY